MINNNLLTEAEEKQIEKKFELKQNCDGEYVVNRLKRNKIVLMDIINICEHMIMNYDEIIDDIHHHNKLNQDFYRRPSYDGIKDEYQPIITKRLCKFNRWSKSLNRENKRTNLAINKWLKEYGLDSNYMHYVPFDNEIKDNSSAMKGGEKNGMDGY